VPADKYIHAFDDLSRSIHIAYEFCTEPDTTYNPKLYVPNPEFQPTPGKMNKDIKTKLDSIRKSLLESLSTNLRQKPYRDNLAPHQRKLLDTLTSDNNLKVVNSDKNLGPVLFTVPQYIKLCLDHINENPESYTKVETIPLEEMQQTVVDFHSDLTEHFANTSGKRSDITNAKYIIYKLNDTKPSRFHCTPKIHKLDRNGLWTKAMRPIVSCLNNPTYGLSKWLDSYLGDVMKRTESYTRDSDQFLAKLRDTALIPNDCIATLDAVSLYTSIPQEEAIRAIYNMLNGHPLQDFLVRATRIVLSYNYFEYGDTNWKQKAGIAMGTPAAVAIANLYLAFYEQSSVLPLFRSNLVLFNRFIDDLFIVWRATPGVPNSSFDDFRRALSQAPGIEWTVETQLGTTADFLDLTISLNGCLVTSKTFQKSLNLYLYTPAHSAHPPGVFKGLIKGLMIKYARQNSNREDLEHIINKLHKRLVARGFKSAQVVRDINNLYAELQLSGEISSKRTAATVAKPLFFKVPFDPNGPSKAELKTIAHIQELNKLITELHFPLGPILICYSRPASLGDLITKTSMLGSVPSVSSLLADQRPSP
jgi:hypothetical protein